MMSGEDDNNSDDGWNATQTLPSAQDTKTAHQMVSTTIANQTVAAACTTIFKKPNKRPRKKRTSCSNAQAVTVSSHVNEQTLNAIATLSAKIDNLQHVIVTPNNWSSLDILRHRTQLLERCEQCLHIAVYRKVGYLQYVLYSVCVVSAVPIADASQFIQEPVFFAPGNGLHHVYVLAWNNSQEQHVLCVAEIYNTVPHIAIDILHFSQCVSNGMLN